jgi:hypothetical protein
MAIRSASGARALNAGGDKPLIGHQVTVEPIAATTTDTGLKVHCQLDPNLYPAGVKGPTANPEPSAQLPYFQGQWSNTTSPKVLALER